MAWTWLDLLLFSVSVYGLAWLVTCSKLVEPLRVRVARVPLLGRLVRCVVCTATWIGFAIVLLLPQTTVFSAGFRARTVLDVVVLVGWVVAFSWGLGRALGDAD